MKHFDIPEISVGEFIIEVTKDTSFQYLIYYAAPWTLDGKIVVPAGSRFAISQSAGEVAFYMHLFGNEKLRDDELIHKMEVLANKAHPEIAGKLTGFSFLITELQLKSENVSFIKGEKQKLLEIISKQKEEAEYFRNYNPYEDPEWVHKNFPWDGYREFKAKIIKKGTDSCPSCGHKLRQVFWGKVTGHILQQKKNGIIFIGEETYGDLEQNIRPDYACGYCGEAYVCQE